MTRYRPGCVDTHRRVALSVVLAGVLAGSGCGSSEHTEQQGAGGGEGGSGGAAPTGGTGGASGTGGGAACTGSCEPVVCDGSYEIATGEEFDAFTALGCQVVTGTLRIAQTDLTSIAALVIERVDQDLFVVANPNLETLDGLSGVRSVGRNLTIASNQALASLLPLTTWPADAVTGDLSIFSNPALPQCDVDALDAHLTASCVNCSGNGTGSCP